MEKITAEGRDRATLSVFRSVSSSVRPTVFSTVVPRGRRTPACASPHAHACRVRILAPDTPPTGARAAVALPRNRASRRQGHWPSPLPIDPSLRPLAPPLPGAVLHSSALPTSAARALAWRITLRRLAPVVALLFNASPTRHLTLSPPPSSSDRWPASPPSRAVAQSARSDLLLCSLSMHRLHFASLTPYPSPLPFSPQSFNPTLILHRFPIFLPPRVSLDAHEPIQPLPRAIVALPGALLRPKRRRATSLSSPTTTSSWTSSYGADLRRETPR